MSKKGTIILMLFISWPVNNLHRLLNNTPVNFLHLYPFSPLSTEDLQWYVHDVFESISYILILLAIKLYIETLRNRIAEVDEIIKCFVIIQIIDLFHYLGWHRRSELILTIECLIFIYTALKIFKKYRNGQTR